MHPLHRSHGIRHKPSVPLLRPYYGHERLLRDVAARSTTSNCCRPKFRYLAPRSSGTILAMPANSARDEWAVEREEMVRTQLARRGIQSEAVLQAMREVPREWFVPSAMVRQAYHDGALPIERGQTISQPYIVARMTELLEVQPEDRVLEIGTGTGYQTAILALLARHVFTIEWHLKLMNAAAQCLERLGQHNVTFRCGDGSLGWPERAPYDAIIVTAGAPDVPEPLREQLAVGGRLVIPVGEMENQVLVRVRRSESGYEREEHLRCRFVKLLGERGWPE